jgi:hypothetical protein
MSDQPTPTERPTEADDELVTRVLDGEATPGDVRLVDVDPVLRARLEELRGIAVAVAGVPPLSSDVREALIGTALDAAEPEDQALHRVVRLDDRRRARWPAVMAAAAALIVALGTISAVLGADDATSTYQEVGQAATEPQRSDESFDAADDGTDRAAESGVAADAMESAPGAVAEALGPSAPTTTAVLAAPVIELGDLGRASTPSDLALRARTASLAPPVPPVADPVAAVCPNVVEELPGTMLDGVGTARLVDRSVVVALRTDPVAATSTLVVFDRSTCQPISLIPAS